MPKYLLAYHQNEGSAGGMPEGEEEMAAMMNAWETWYGGMGDKVVDGGNPIAFAKTIASDGSVSDGGGVSPLTGYTLINADNIDAAVEMAKGCPVLNNEGSVEVAEAIDM